MVCAASKHMGGAGSQVEVADTMKRKLPEPRTSISWSFETLSTLGCGNIPTEEANWLKGNVAAETPLYFGSPWEPRWCSLSETCLPALSWPNTTSKPGEVDHPCCVAFPWSPHSPLSQQRERLHCWAKALEQGWKDLSAFLFYPSTLPFSVFFFGSFSLTWFSFSVSLGQKRRKNNKQPEEIFPVVLHTLQCTRIVKWSLGAKTVGGEIRETAMILI